MLVNAFRRGWLYAVLAGALLVIAALFAATGASSAKAQAQTMASVLPGAALPAANVPAATCVPNYAITQSTVTSYPTGTALVGGSRCDDCVFNITLPFAYSLYGQSFASVSGSSNGQLDFTGQDRSFANNCLPDGNVGYAIFPHWIDLTMDVNNVLCTGCGVYTSVSGASPNRTFNVEYRALDWLSNQPVRFIVRLYEGQQTFDIIYVAIDATDTPLSTIGVQDGTNGTISQYQCPGSPGSLAPNSMLTFTLTGVCTTSTPTYTAVATQTFTPVATATRTRTSTATPVRTNTVISTGTPTPTNTAVNTATRTGTATNTTVPTQTATAAATRTATRTVTPAATRVLDGHVTWGGRISQPSQYQQAPISITLIPAGGGAPIEYPVRNTTTTGHFVVDVTSLPNGNYNWRVKGPVYLARAGTLTLSGAPVTSVEMGTMMAGDGNGDNTVNAPDFNILKNSFGSTCGNGRYDLRADYTGECVVDIRDFNQLRNNFGTVGAP